MTSSILPYVALRISGHAGYVAAVTDEQVLTSRFFIVREGAWRSHTFALSANIIASPPSLPLHPT